MGFQMNLALRTLSLVLIGLILCCSVLADIVILKSFSTSYFVLLACQYLLLNVLISLSYYLTRLFNLINLFRIIEWYLNSTICVSVWLFYSFIYVIESWCTILDFVGMLNQFIFLLVHIALVLKYNVRWWWS